MAMIGFSDEEQEYIRALAEHYDKTGTVIALKDLPRYEEFGQQKVLDLVARLKRYDFVEFHSRDSLKIFPLVLDIVDQIDNPPVPNYWQELRKWLLKSKWRVAIVAAFVLLPLIVKWVEMLKTMLTWIGVMSE